MGSYALFVPAILGVIIAASLIALIGRLVADRIQAQQDRIYKTKDDHITLNASSREEWMSGQLIGSDEEKLNRFSHIIAPLAQIITVVVLVIVVIIWNVKVIDANARLDDRISDLELQIHAIALSGNNTTSTPAGDGYPPEPAGVAAKGTPMQQACANLIGRVADAYEKGQSSKIGQSLEELVQKLGCINSLAK